MFRGILLHGSPSPRLVILSLLLTRVIGSEQAAGIPQVRIFAKRYYRYYKRGYRPTTAFARPRQFRRLLRTKIAPSLAAGPIMSHLQTRTIEPGKGEPTYADRPRRARDK